MGRGMGKGDGRKRREREGGGLGARSEGDTREGRQSACECRTNALGR